MNSSRRPFIIFGIVIATAIILRMIYWLSPMKESRVVIGGQSIVVEVARDEETRRQGLSGRMTLAEDHGMLFLFPEKDRERFWMKDMLIPLDIIWIDEGKIVDIANRVPAPAFGMPDVALLFYEPRAPAKMVLEVNAGTVERFGWKVGDAYRWSCRGLYRFFQPCYYHQMTFAVIKTGGKQYIVREGAVLTLEKLEGNAGDAVTFSEVLLVADEIGEKVTTGVPFVFGAKVEGKIVEQGKGKKIFIIKYKPKVHYRRKRGHRQLQTKVKIEKINA